MDLGERNPILKNGVKRTWMRWTFTEKIICSLHFMTEMTSNDLIGSNIWRHFRSWKMKTKPISFGKSSTALEFLSPPFLRIEFRSSRSKLFQFIYFQAVALCMPLTTLHHDDQIASSCSLVSNPIKFQFSNSWKILISNPSLKRSPCSVWSKKKNMLLVLCVADATMIIPRSGSSKSLRLRGIGNRISGWSPKFL